MAGKMTPTFVMFTLFAMLHFGYVLSNPAIATGYEPIEICIENCVICRNMLGAWFEGPLCAESCIKHKGKLILECENFASIKPFLNKLRMAGRESDE